MSLRSPPAGTTRWRARVQRAHRARRAADGTDPGVRGDPWRESKTVRDDDTARRLRRARPPSGAARLLVGGSESAVGHRHQVPANVGGLSLSRCGGGCVHSPRSRVGQDVASHGTERVLHALDDTGATTADAGHSSLGPGIAITVAGLRLLLRNVRGETVCRHCGGPLRQHASQKLLRDSRVRTSRPSDIPRAWRRADSHLPLKRGLGQSTPSALHPRLSDSDKLRTAALSSGSTSKSFRPRKGVNSTALSTVCA